MAGNPEEQIRQNWIRYLQEELYFPKEHIVVEKSLSKLPHLTLCSNLPKRRVDILCYAKEIHPHFELYPLLMIECKAHSLGEKARRQVIGYNRYVKAMFVAVVNAKAVYLGYFDSRQGSYQFVNTIPTYAELIESARSALALTSKLFS